MHAVLNWLKSNIATVIFLVVMIAALVALPIVSGRLNEGIRTTVKERLDRKRALEQLEKTQVEIVGVSGPPISERALVNQSLLERFIEVAEAESEDAKLVQARALEHNRRGRGVLMSGVLPEPIATQAEVLPRQFHGRLIEAHERLLADVGAGSPPDVEAMKADLQRKRAQFMSGSMGALEAAEQTRLQQELTNYRMSLYAQEADEVQFYAAPEALNLPVWDQAVQPSWTDLFLWQWQYWINEDILHALEAANEGTGTVMRAPVKRVLSVAIYDDAFAGGSSRGSRSAGSGGGGGQPALGAAGGRRSTGGGGNTPDGPPPVRRDPSREIRPDYGLSVTGRSSNPIYDVRRVRLDLVVETARIPAVLDALARRNFITVLDLTLRPADIYAAAENGFFYGTEPVSELTLELETIWLREWTEQFMPDEVKRALAIPTTNPVG